MRVYDGPDRTAENEVDVVFVGFDGDWVSGTFESASINQSWPYLGNTSRLEDVSVPCCVESWTGDMTPKTARDRAVVLLAGVETVLRTDPTLGIDGSTVAVLTVGIPYQEPSGSGYLCRIVFTVDVKTTLLTT